MIEFTFTEDLCRIIHGKMIADTKKTLLSYHFIEKGKTRKYISGMLYIDIDEAYLENKISSSMILATLITNI